MRDIKDTNNDSSRLPWRRMGYPSVSHKVADNNNKLGDVIEVNATHCVIKWHYGQFAFCMAGLIRANEKVWGISHSVAGKYLELH
jgi:hypothetical protein